jgi:hypothetical protein
MLFAIACIWLRPLWPVDETRYASVAWEMWLRGDFLVPYINGEPYSHKPPLLFWLIHAGWIWLPQDPEVVGRQLFDAQREQEGVIGVRENEQRQEELAVGTAAIARQMVDLFEADVGVQLPERRVVRAIVVGAEAEQL